MNKITPNQLKFLIKEKFGSVQRYLRLSGKTMKHFNDAIKAGKENAFWKEANKVQNRAIQGELTEELIKKIRDQIYIQYENQSNFCRSKGYSINWISTLINGKCKRVSKKVAKVMKDLKIQHQW